MVTVRVKWESVQITVLGMAMLIFLQLSVDIPGVDIPDLKDLPDLIESLQ